MASQETGPKGRSPATITRSHVTPPGYKNVRVFVTKSLHFRLLSAAAAEERTLQQFVVECLEKAAPTVPSSSPQGQTPVPVTPPDSGPSDCPQSGPIEAGEPPFFRDSKAPATKGFGQALAPVTDDAVSARPDASPVGVQANNPTYVEGGSRA